MTDSEIESLTDSEFQRVVVDRLSGCESDLSSAHEVARETTRLVRRRRRGRWLRSILGPRAGDCASG